MVYPAVSAMLKSFGLSIDKLEARDETIARLLLCRQNQKF